MKTKNKKTLIKILSFLILLMILVPIISFAQLTGDKGIGAGTGKGGGDVIIPGAGVGKTSGTGCSASITNLTSLITFFTCVIRVYIIPLLFTVALGLFIFGVVKFISKADQEKERTEGRKFMIWGIVVLFVITSVWGLVAVLTGTFGIGFFVPQLPQ